MSEPMAKAFALSEFFMPYPGGPLVIPTEFLTELARYVG
jgi:hypothetical protein